VAAVGAAVKALLDPMVGEAYGHVQGASLKPYAALPQEASQLPVRQGESKMTGKPSRTLARWRFGMGAAFLALELSASPAPGAEYETVGAAARIYSFVAHPLSGSKVQVHDGIADFPLARAPENDQFVKALDRDPCAFALGWKAHPGAPAREFEIINFHKLSREYSLESEGYGNMLTLTFTGMSGVHVVRDFPVKGKDGWSSLLRFDPVTESSARQIISAIEFIEGRCPPAERKPY